PSEECARMDGTDQTPFPLRTLRRDRRRRSGAGYRCAAPAGRRCRPSDEHRRGSLPTRLYRGMALGSTQEQPVTGGVPLAGLAASAAEESRLFSSANDNAVKRTKALRAVIRRID